MTTNEKLSGAPHVRQPEWSPKIPLPANAAYQRYAGDDAKNRSGHGARKIDGSATFHSLHVVVLYDLFLFRPAQHTASDCSHDCHGVDIGRVQFVIYFCLA